MRVSPSRDMNIQNTIPHDTWVSIIHDQTDEHTIYWTEHGLWAGWAGVLV